MLVLRDVECTASMARQATFPCVIGHRCACSLLGQFSFFTHGLGVHSLSWDISTKEAVSTDCALLSCCDLSNAWVDVLVDNQAVIHSWNNQDGRSAPLNHAIKQLFFTPLKWNIYLNLSYVPTGENPADVPSRRLSAMDSRLSPFGQWFKKSLGVTVIPVI